MHHSPVAASPLVLVLILAVALALAPPLPGAGASDLVGSWSVDGDATWDCLSKSPQIAKQLAGLAPEMIEQVKATMLTQVAATTYQFTADKLICVANGLRREESYKVTASNGDVLTADCIDDQGKVIQSRVTVAKDRLEIANVADPAEVVVLRRVR